MNPAQDPESRQPAELERVLSLLSRQLDGDLTPDESTELTGLLQAETVQASLAAMTDLRNHLKALPVRPVSDSFVSAVHNAIHQPTKTVPVPDPRRGWIMRGIVAVSVTACTAALILFLQRSDAEPHDLAASGAPTGNAPAATQSMNIAAPGADSSMDAALASEGLEVFTPPPAVADLNSIAQREHLRPYLENDDWRIVVVQVHSRDRDAVMRGIESLVAKNGMAIQPVAGSDGQDARFGVLLTSSEANGDAFISSVLSESDAKSADWNAESIADSSREDLIHSVQESLKTPTHSELHFGQVYMMTLPNSQEPPAAAPPLLAQNDAAGSDSDPSARTEKRSEPTKTLPETPTVRATPVFVVFEFTDETPQHI